MVIARLKIDREHSLKLLMGQPVTIKVPPNAARLELRLDLAKSPRHDDSFAKICDVFFNGRRA